jgi:hypothetical protein
MGRPFSNIIYMPTFGIKWIPPSSMVKNPSSPITSHPLGNPFMHHDPLQMGYNNIKKYKDSN